MSNVRYFLDIILSFFVLFFFYFSDICFFFFFFFQAEDGIRDTSVTGVQTCALPISGWPIPFKSCERAVEARPANGRRKSDDGRHAGARPGADVHRCRPLMGPGARSEERRVGKECRCRGATSN